MNKLLISACLGLLACEESVSNNTIVTEANQAIAGVVIPGIGWGSPGTTWSVESNGTVSWCCSTWYVPIPTNTGDAIAGLTIPVRDNGSANSFPNDGNNIIITLDSESPSGETILGSVSSNGSGNRQTLVLTLSSAHVVSNTEALILKATALSGGALPGPASHMSAIGVIQPQNILTLNTISIPLAYYGPSGTIIPPIYKTQAGTLNAVFIAGFTIPQGQHIRQLRASVQDDNHSTLAIALGRMGSEGSGTFNTGVPSNGSGQVQTIFSPVMDVSVSATNAYYAVIRTVTGNTACNIFWIEVDYN